MTKLKFCALIAAAALATSGGVAKAQDNDTCATARTISSLPFFDTADTTSGYTDTMDNSASVGFGGGGSPDAWWVYTPSADAVDTFVEVGFFDTGFAIYSGPCGALVEELAVDNFIGPESAVFTFQAGTTYHILCEGFTAADVGEINLKVGLVAHSDCEMALSLDNSSFPFTETGLSNAVQTLAIFPMTNTGGDLWYDVTFTANGGYTFDWTPATDNDLVIVQFAFQDCDNLNQAILYDTGLNGDPETSGEIIGFAGDNYSFAVQGFNQDDVDPFDFSLTFVAGASVDEWEAY